MAFLLVLLSALAGVGCRVDDESGSGIVGARCNCAGLHIRAGQPLLSLHSAGNLGLVGGIKRKVFMGDAGSTVIGFAAVWLLIVSPQSDEAVIAPATALWLIAVPLADMCAVSLRRLRSGVSPFRPDRGHIHHIVMKCGFSSRQTLGILLVAASGCAVRGIVFDKTAVPEWLSLLLFLLCFVAWLRFSSCVYRR